jgi:hypothetical protein
MYLLLYNNNNERIFLYWNILEWDTYGFGALTDVKILVKTIVNRIDGLSYRIFFVSETIS